MIIRHASQTLFDITSKFFCSMVNIIICVCVCVCVYIYIYILIYLYIYIYINIYIMLGGELKYFSV